MATAITVVPKGSASLSKNATRVAQQQGLVGGEALLQHACLKWGRRIQENLTQISTIGKTKLHSNRTLWVGGMKHMYAPH